MDLQRLEILTIIAKELKARNLCLCDNYNEWYKFGNACACYGESGREVFHLFSSTSRYYHTPNGVKECDYQFNQCLKHCNVRDGVDYLIKTLIPPHVLNISDLLRDNAIYQIRETAPQTNTQTRQTNHRPTPRRGYRVLR